MPHFADELAPAELWESQGRDNELRLEGVEPGQRVCTVCKCSDCVSARAKEPLNFIANKRRAIYDERDEWQTWRSSETPGGSKAGYQSDVRRASRIIRGKLPSCAKSVTHPDAVRVRTRIPGDPQQSGFFGFFRGRLFFDGHVFEFAGFKDLATLLALDVLDVFFAGNDLDTGVFAHGLHHASLTGFVRRGWQRWLRLIHPVQATTPRRPKTPESPRILDAAYRMSSEINGYSPAAKLRSLIVFSVGAWNSHTKTIQFPEVLMLAADSEAGKCRGSWPGSGIG